MTTDRLPQRGDRVRAKPSGELGTVIGFRRSGKLGGVLPPEYSFCVKLDDGGLVGWYQPEELDLIKPSSASDPSAYVGVKS